VNVDPFVKVIPHRTARSTLLHKNELFHTQVPKTPAQTLAL
jgi:hypothetical protein